MMDRIALAKSSARCWTRLGKAFSREADRLSSQWETLGEEPGRRALDACEAAGFSAIHLSLSHDGGLATAYVVIEG